VSIRQQKNDNKRQPLSTTRYVVDRRTRAEPVIVQEYDKNGDPLSMTPYNVAKRKERNDELAGPQLYDKKGKPLSMGRDAAARRRTRATDVEVDGLPEYGTKGKLLNVGQDAAARRRRRSAQVDGPQEHDKTGKPLNMGKEAVARRRQRAAKHGMVADHSRLGHATPSPHLSLGPIQGAGVVASGLNITRARSKPTGNEPKYPKEWTSKYQCIASQWYRPQPSIRTRPAIR
jgi:hypothetical protein